MTTTHSKAATTTSTESKKGAEAAPAHVNATVFMPPQDLAQAPAVPAGAPTLEKGEAKKMKHLTHEQIAVLAAVATDFQGSKTWAADFGAHAPSQATMVAMVQGTSAVFSESSNAENWERYVAVLRALCGDSLAGQLELLGATYAAAIAQNPGLAQTYPNFSVYLNARSAAVSKAHATKLANQKAEEASKAAAAAAPAAAPAPVAAGATPHP